MGEPDLWAVLRAVRGTPTVIAEIDTTPAGLEHNVAKYLWWANRHGCFWGSPSIIVSAFTESLPQNYALHETIARFLGERGTRRKERVPDLAAGPRTPRGLRA